MLSHQEFERYQKQIILEEVGYEGQKSLKSARVLCVGAGGLGCSLLLYLVAAGVGNIGIIDADKVSLGNLHRQILFSTEDCGLSKSQRAKFHLDQLNENCNIEFYDEFLTEENAESIINKYDIVTDCSDNFKTRFLVNDVCCRLNKPDVFACVQKMKGYCSVFATAEGPCYRCLFPSEPDARVLNCAQSGVLGPVVGVLGNVQANEVIKLILGVGESLIGRVFVYDALNAKVENIRLNRIDQCHAVSN